MLNCICKWKLNRHLKKLEVEPYRKLKIKNVDLFHKIFEDKVIQNVYFKDCYINSSFINLTFENCIFDNCYFNNVIMLGSFEQCGMISCLFEKSVIDMNIIGNDNSFYEVFARDCKTAAYNEYLITSLSD